MARQGLNVTLGRGIFVFLLLLPLMTGLGWMAAQNPSFNGNAIIGHLNMAIRWFRMLQNIDVAAGQPSDTLYLQNARNLANQALQLAFQSAQAEAALISTQEAAHDEGPATQESTTEQNIAKAAANTADRIQSRQSQINDLNKQVDRATGKKRQELSSQRDALQGELDLDKALQDSLNKIQSFLNTTDNVNTGLLGQINNLKRSVPELAATNASINGKNPSTGQNTKATRADQAGLIGQASILFSQMGDVHDIDQLIAETNQLRTTADKLQAPLRDALRTTIQQGRDAAAQPPTSDPAQAQALRRNLTQLTTKFKELSNAAVPLRQEMIVLEQCNANLVEWRRSVVKQYTGVLRSLLTRVAIILVALGIIAIFSALWQRAAMRYVHDLRRRRQILLVRRFAVGFLMAVVIVLGFISEFSSLATFAGFITAGLAVALQTVILSVAAYFFLIGRYGVRVGDRITVSGVTGDVIEVGLVRMYMMELAGTGIDLYPTGRAVVFSNSVFFQASPFYKQLPGTAYTWHEVAVPLSAGTDPAGAEKELLQAVSSVYSQYEQSMQRQHQAIAQLVDTSLGVPAPHPQLRLGETGPEFVVRYPVDIRRAAETDEQVTRKLMETINSSPELKSVVAGPLKLRSPIKA